MISVCFLKIGTKFVSRKTNYRMKKIIQLLPMLCIGFSLQAQLYSSGNNTITGNNIGIGTNTPLSNLHIKGAASIADEIRIQHVNFTTGASRLSFFNDTASGFSATANYAVLNKYAAGVIGNVAPNFPSSKLFGFNNSQGDLLFSSGGNIGFGYYNQSSSTVSPKLLIHTNGYVGIGGNQVPASNAHINSVSTGDTLKITNATTGHTTTDGLDIRTAGNAASIINRENSTLGFGTNNVNRVTIDATGNVVIGTTTTPAGYKLYVETGILTEKVKVAVKTSGNWADYVFADNYVLKPLSEVENYIHENKHLPGIPSANEVVENGIDLATMDAKLLEKIEELTLHMIQMEKEIKQLKAENAILQSNASNNDK